MGRKHNIQAPRDRMSFVCTHCKAGDCQNCMDIKRVVVMGKEPLCACQRKGHSGEPIECQIADPFDGSVHGPGMVVSEDGKVEFDEAFREEFKRQFSSGD